jgi:agmatinase
MKKYAPVDPQQFPRFAGIKTFMRLPHIRTTADIDFAIVGVPWDGGASFRTGQRTGPDAIRSVSSLLRPFNMDLDVKLFEHCAGVDYGDLSVVPGYIEDSYQRIEAELYPLIDAGVIPILLGGDHSITLPELRAVARKHGPIALVHFDSHTDTYDEYFGRPHNHGTPFCRAVEEGLLDGEHCIQIGMRGSVYSKDDYAQARSYGFDQITMTEVRESGIAKIIERIHSRVGDKKTFVTFDIDVVDPAFAPGTGTPEVGGLTSGEAMSLAAGLNGLNIVGFDLVEVLPEYDPAAITALLAANIVYQFISIIAATNKSKQSDMILNH